MGGIRVAVIGAGIAGLTVAASLARSGVECTVFERADRLTEAGGGIQLSPNASRQLHRLGLAGRLDAVAIRPEAIELRRWLGGDVIARTELGAACESAFGAPYYTMHRAELHLGLHTLVADRVQLGRRCVGLAETTGGARLRFADGSRASADVVVGADGIGSVVREVLVPDRPRFSGVTVYRGLVRANRLPHRHREPKVVIWLGPGQHCVSYPVSRWVSFVATAPAGDGRTAPAGDGRAESWTAPGRVADLVGAYANWHSEVRDTLAAADSVTRWALHDRAPLARWRTRRVTVVGDAAHAMLPFGAQGASQAIEDAAALAVCLSGATAEEIPAALRRYEQARMPRVARVAAAVRENARDHHLADGDEQRRRDQAMTRGLRQQDWLYGYDAEAAVPR